MATLGCYHLTACLWYLLEIVFCGQRSKNTMALSWAGIQMMPAQRALLSSPKFRTLLEGLTVKPGERREEGGIGGGRNTCCLEGSGSYMCRELWSHQVPQMS